MAPPGFDMTGVVRPACGSPSRRWRVLSRSCVALVLVAVARPGLRSSDVFALAPQAFLRCGRPARGADRTARFAEAYAAISSGASSSGSDEALEVEAGDRQSTLAADYSAAAGIFAGSSRKAAALPYKALLQKVSNITGWRFSQLELNFTLFEFAKKQNDKWWVGKEPKGAAARLHLPQLPGGPTVVGPFREQVVTARVDAMKAMVKELNRIYPHDEPMRELDLLVARKLGAAGVTRKDVVYKVLEIVQPEEVKEQNTSVAKWLASVTLNLLPSKPTFWGQPAYFIKGARDAAAQAALSDPAVRLAFYATPKEEERWRRLVNESSLVDNIVWMRLQERRNRPGQASKEAEAPAAGVSRPRRPKASASSEEGGARPRGRTPRRPEAFSRSQFGVARSEGKSEGRQEEEPPQRGSGSRRGQEDDLPGPWARTQDEWAKALERSRS